MDFINSIFQGVVQGLTEFLPISSSGHLSVIQHFSGIEGSDATLLTILLHLGTLLAVFIAFRKTIATILIELCCMIKDLFCGKLFANKPTPIRRMVILLIIAQIPMVFALLLSDFYTGLGADSDIIVEGFAFLLTAGLLFLSDRFVKGHRDASNLKAGSALLVGCAQAIAPVPGISRSGSTICTGLMCGMTREFAVEFSFIMGIPAVFMANVLEFTDVVRSDIAVNWLPIIAGVVAAAVFGLLAIKLVRWLVKTDKFKYFGYYLLLLGLVVITIGVIEKF